MISVDTNVLARFYIDDPTDPEAPAQRPRARALLEAGTPLFVTVVLELEWVMRAFYDLLPADFARVVEHLAGLSHVRIEDWPAVLDAVHLHAKGLDFADALHLARSIGCERLATFDDRRFAKRTQRLGTTPTVQSIRCSCSSGPCRVRATTILEVPSPPSSGYHVGTSRREISPI